MPPGARPLYSLLFFLSGMAGLIYEVCWTQLLRLPMGNTVYSLTAVLTALMGGLALGAFLAGRWIDRRGRPLRVYAQLEAGIGVFCLTLPWVIQAETPIFRWVYQSFSTTFVAFHLFKFVACGLVLLVPATLMGATLPILCRYFVDQPGRIGRSLGWLYAVNAFGAVTGSLLAGFVLIPQLGLRGAMLSGVATSLTVAAIAWRAQARFPHHLPVAAAPAARRSRGATRTVEPVNAFAPLPRTLRAGVLVGYGLSGLAALLFQSAWARVLALVIGPSVYAFALLVSAFILGLAIGSSAAARFADKQRNPVVAFACAQLGIGITALAMVPVLQHFPEWMLHLVPQLSQNFGRFQFAEFGLVFLALLLPTAFMGMSLPFVGRAVVRGLDHAGEAVGTAYSSNTVGTILGAFLGGFVFLPHLGIQRTILAAAGLNLAVAVALLALGLPRRRALPAAAVAGLAGALAVLFVPPFNPMTLTSGTYLYAYRVLKRLGHGTSFADLMRSEYSMLYYREGLGSTITVKEDLSGVRQLAIDGKVDASDDQDMAMQALLGHIPSLLHPQPHDVAVIGLGSGVTLHSVALHPSVRSIDCIEIMPEMVQAARLFDHVNGRVLDDPRVHLVIQDGRNHLTLTRRKYDLILSEPSNPWMAGIASLYTREFFAACRDRLHSRGLMAVFLHLYSMDLRTFRDLTRTFQAVFPNMSFWETSFGVDYLMIGARDDMAVDWQEMVERMSAPGVAADLARIGVHGPAGLLVRHLADADGVRTFAGSGPLYTDDRDRLEFEAPRLLHHRPDFAEPAALQNLREQALPVWLRLPADGLAAPEREAIETRRAAQSDFWRGMVSKNEGRSDEAASSFLAALQQDPWVDGLPENLLETSRELVARAKAAGDTTAALSLYRRIVGLNPELADFQNELGMALGNAGRLTEAEAAYRKAVELGPRKIYMRKHLALTLARERKVPEAEAQLRAVLEQRPGDVQARVYVAELYMAAGALRDAERECRAAIAANPHPPDPWLLLGEVLFHEGAYRPAVRAVEDALARGAPESRAQLLLADCYTKLGESDKAAVAAARGKSSARAR